MKTIAVLCLFVITNISFGQSKREKAFTTFRNNYQQYILAANNLLAQTNIDPVIPDLVARVLPRVANEDIEGAVFEVMTIFYQRKGIRSLDPEFTNYIRYNCRSIIDAVASENYALLMVILPNIYMGTDNFLKNGVIPYTPKTKIVPATYSSTPNNDYGQSNESILGNMSKAAQNGWKHNYIEELLREFKDLMWKSIREQGKMVPSDMVDDLANCIVDKLISGYRFSEFTNLSGDGQRNVYNYIGKDCMNNIK